MLWKNQTFSGIVPDAMAKKPWRGHPRSESSHCSLFRSKKSWMKLMKILGLQMFSISPSVPFSIGNRFFNFIYRFRRKIILSYWYHRIWLLIMPFSRTIMVSNTCKLFVFLFHPNQYRSRKNYNITQIC